MLAHREVRPLNERRVDLPAGSVPKLLKFLSEFAIFTPPEIML